MRQGQQHRRGRGRNNNNNNNNHSHNHNHRKGHNPLSRSFESNGPDVKVRGTPAHVAEKYLSLARDAQSSGDPVLAENYLQHAEHYNRIIMTYREQQVQQSGEPINGAPRMRPEGGEEFQEDQGDDIGNDDQPPMARFSQEQPRFQDQPRNDQPRNDEGRQQRSPDQGRYRDRHDRNQNRHQEARQPRERNGEGHQPPPDDEGNPQPRVDQQPRVEPRSEPPQQRRRERFGPGNEQPEFLRRPVRRPRRESGTSGDSDEVVEGGREDGPQDKTPV